MDVGTLANIRASGIVARPQAIAATGSRCTGAGGGAEPLHEATAGTGNGSGPQAD
jgi:hypothetical protein